MARKKREEWVLKDYLAEYEALKSERTEWETEARRISSFIVPGRGVFNDFTRPVKRKLTSPKVVNPAAKDALRVFTSGLQGGLTSPSRPWFKLAFNNPDLNKVKPLADWLYDCEKRLYAGLSESNFYSAVHSFYTEFGAFGTAPMYVGEDGEPFRFELLTFGEYCIGLDSKGVVNRFYRIVFRTGQMLLDDYEDRLPESMKMEKSKDWLNEWFTCLEATVPAKIGNKPFKRVLYLMGYTSQQQQGKGRRKELQLNQSEKDNGCLLSASGFHEFPYPTGRFDVIGSDVYGIGPGAEALPDVMRLQEMEKSASMAVHKSVNPPLFVPAHLKSKLKTLPGGINYSRNTMNEKVSSLYDTRFDYQGVLAFVDRVVHRIQTTFFNDVFLTAVRDPNASPMKAAEVNVKENEKMLRLGPVIERLHFEFLQPLIERCFNIMMRKGLFQELDDQLKMMLTGETFDIRLVSVLAQAQKAIGIQPIQNFISMVGAVAAVKQDVLDKVNTDGIIDESADIMGVPSNILNGDEVVQQIRAQRQQMMQQEKDKQDAMMQQQMQNEALKSQADASRSVSEAGVNINDIFGA